jgi:hypothetical protein
VVTPEMIEAGCQILSRWHHLTYELETEEETVKRIFTCMESLRTAAILSKKKCGDARGQ